MTSKLKVETNRRNAKKSTGPKTDAGKAKLALNAVTHGLSAKPILDTKSQKKIDNLVIEFAGGDTNNPEVMTLAHEAAEAQIMIERVKDARNRAWHDASRDQSISNRGELSALNDRATARQFLKDSGLPVSGLKRIMPDSFKPPFETDIEREAAILNLAAGKLSKLIRFERRAANQRDKALRQLAQIKEISE
jgi:hypothetical protein